MHQEESAACNQQAIIVVQVRMNDDIRDAGLVFQAKKDEAHGRAGALASNHSTRVYDIAFVRAGV